jgi:rhamnogalacturonan acetylesterase
LERFRDDDPADIQPTTRRLAVSQLGGPAKGAYFVPHGAYAAQAMKNMGQASVNANYPNDHTHTSPFLADVMSRSFVLGLKCGTSGLAALVLNATESLTAASGVLGDCIAHNSSLPVRSLDRFASLV